MIILGIGLFLLGGLELAAGASLGSPTAWAVLGSGWAAWAGSLVPAHFLAGGALWAGSWFSLRRSALFQKLLTQSGRDHSRLIPALFAFLLFGVGIHLVLEQVREFENLATRHTDFKTFLEAARAVASGEDPYHATEGAFFYPPPFAHFMRPLALLPSGVASLIWLLFKSALVVALMTRVRDRFATGLSLVGQRWLTFALLVGTARFWLSDLAYGNTNLIVAALVTFALLDDLDDKPRRAGFGLGLAAIIKVTPLVALPAWIIRARWKSLAACAVTMAGLAALGLIFAQSQGLAEWRSYLAEGVAAKVGGSLAQPDNQSLRGLLERSLGSGGAAKAAWIAVWTLLVVWWGWLTRETERSGDPRNLLLATAAWPAVILLVSPGSWVVHYVMAILPFTAMTSVFLRNPRAPFPLAVFALTNFAFTMSGWWRPTVRWSIHQSWFVAALLLILVLLHVEIRRRGAEKPAIE